MEKLIRLVSSISGKQPSPVSTLFSLKPSVQPLDDAFYVSLAKQILQQPQQYQHTFEQRSKHALPAHIVLRILLLWHYATRQEVRLTCFIRKLELEVDKKSKSQRTISAEGLVESYIEYMHRQSILQVLDGSSWSLKQWIRVALQLIKLMHLAFHIEASLENEWSRFKGETTLPLISHLLVADCQQYLRILFQFVAKFPPLILEKHSDSDDIYSIYEQVLHINREAERRLARINASKDPIPTLQVDREMNRKIELFMSERTRQRPKAPRIVSTSIDIVQQTENELAFDEQLLAQSYRPFTTKGW